MTTIHEISNLLRDHNPAFRIYESRQIEDMREAIPAYANRASMAEAKAKRSADALERVIALAVRFRADGRYDISDAIRNALARKP